MQNANHIKIILSCMLLSISAGSLFSFGVPLFFNPVALLISIGVGLFFGGLISVIIHVKGGGDLAYGEGILSRAAIMTLWIISLGLTLFTAVIPVLPFLFSLLVSTLATLPLILAVVGTVVAGVGAGFVLARVIMFIYTNTAENMLSAEFTPKTAPTVEKDHVKSLSKTQYKPTNYNPVPLKPTSSGQRVSTNEKIKSVEMQPKRMDQGLNIKKPVRNFDENEQDQSNYKMITHLMVRYGVDDNKEQPFAMEHKGMGQDLNIDELSKNFDQMTQHQSVGKGTQHPMVRYKTDNKGELLKNEKSKVNKTSLKNEKSKDEQALLSKKDHDVKSTIYLKPPSPNK